MADDLLAEKIAITNELLARVVDELQSLRQELGRLVSGQLSHASAEAKCTEPRWVDDKSDRGGHWENPLCEPGKPVTWWRGMRRGFIEPWDALVDWPVVSVMEIKAHD